jgi:hypothetical protein
MSNLQEKAKKFSEKYSNGKHFRDLEFGYENGFSDCQKEYEEKLRWIPIEEELPTIHVDVILKCESGFWDKGCLIHQSGDNMFSSSSGDLDIVTHWRPISFL